MNPYEKIQSPKMAVSKARTNLLVNHPFFGSLAMRLRPVESTEHETMATDGDKMYFNPEYLKTLNSDQLVGLIAHEVLHVGMKHHERRGARDPGRWQQACDFSINPTIIEAGLSLPEGYLDCEMFHGKSAEEIYAMLPEGDGNDSGGNGVGSGGSGGGPEQSQPEPQGSDGQDKPGDGGGEQGGQHAPDPGSMGQVLDRSKQAPASATGEAWESAMTQAARAAEKAGKMPAALKRVVEQILNPTLPWETLLRRFMTSVSRDDFDWMRPNRRFIGQGLYLPGCYSERMDHMVVAIDTSGSIRVDVLEAFITEVNGIRQEVDCDRVTMLQCSTRLGETRVFEQGQSITADHVTGGGGTSFDPVFDWLREHGQGVECLVYFTDLQVRSIPDDPGIPVLWAEPDQELKWTQKPKYGQRVKIQNRGA